MPGLANELRAADRMMGGNDGRSRATPSARRDAKGNKVELDGKEVERAWDDFFELITLLRWLTARPRSWKVELQEMLPVRERLMLPGELDLVVRVSSDATKELVGAIDWTNGVVAREEVSHLVRDLLEAWGRLLGEREDCTAIHIAEMLSLVAFAAEQGSAWSGAVVLYTGDNQVMRAWLGKRRGAHGRASF